MKERRERTVCSGRSCLCLPHMATTLTSAAMPLSVLSAPPCVPRHSSQGSSAGCSSSHLTQQGPSTFQVQPRGPTELNMPAGAGRRDGLEEGGCSPRSAQGHGQVCLGWKAFPGQTHVNQDEPPTFSEGQLSNKTSPLCVAGGGGNNLPTHQAQQQQQPKRQAWAQTEPVC